MQALYAFILTWTLCGGVAWHMAKRRGGSGQLWAAIGQVLGPFAIPLALMVKRKA